jgi:hypothetical protein
MEALLDAPAALKVKIIKKWETNEQVQFPSFLNIHQ